MTRMMRDNRGFSLIELLVTMLVMTVVLGLSSRALIDVMKADEAITLMSDVNHNLQSSSTNIVRDLVDAGRNVDIGGLPLRTGGGSGSVVRPGPAGAASAGWPTSTVLYAVTPGNNIGPTINGGATDVVTIVSADDRLVLDRNAQVAGNAAGAVVTLAALDTVGTTPFNTVRVGDLFVLYGALSRAVVYVTAVDGSNVRRFTVANGDPANMNKTAATNGGIRQIVASNGNVSAKVKRLKMTTYWTEVGADSMPYLMRQENYRTAVQVGLGVTNLQLFYDVWANGVTTIVDNPFAGGYTPNQFDKAYVTLSVRSDKKFKQTKDFLRNDVTTQVSLRSLQVQKNFQ
jgi:prepilin-type N-terminal cleavage/methylation domain-containing protein